MLARALVCFGLLTSSACVRSAPPTNPTHPAEDRSAALERELADARRQLEMRNAGLEQATVSQAVLDRRIDELKQLNAEIVRRLTTSAHSVEWLAAEKERLAAELQALEQQREQLAFTPEPPEDPNLYVSTPEPADEEDPYASVPDSDEPRSADRDPAEQLATTLEP